MISALIKYSEKDYDRDNYDINKAAEDIVKWKEENEKK